MISVIAIIPEEYMLVLQLHGHQASLLENFLQENFRKKLTTDSFLFLSNSDTTKQLNLIVYLLSWWLAAISSLRHNSQELNWGQKSQALPNL